MSSQPLKVVFAGTPQFAADHLSALLRAGQPILAVYTQPDKPGRRGSRPLPSPVKQVALEAGLPVMQPAEVGDQVLSELHDLQPDVMVVVAYGHKIPPALLRLPRHGCINVHASLLPRWRGAAPIQRAILHGDEQTGITIMRMDEGWDTGDILLQRSCTIDPTDHAGTLEAKLIQLGQASLLEALRQIGEGTISATPQEPGDGIYAVKLSKEEALIDWSRSALEISRAIRAYAPAPVAYTWLGALRIRVWGAEMGPADKPERGNQTPGEILTVQREGIDVVCGEGVLQLKLLQIPIGQGRVLPVSDILNARRDLFVAGRMLTNSASEP